MFNWFGPIIYYFINFYHFNKIKTSDYILLHAIAAVFTN